MSSSLRSDVVVGTRIARAEIRDLIRRNASRREIALYSLLGLLVLPGLLLFTQQAYTVGVLSRDGVAAPIVPAARNLLAPFLLAMMLFGAMGAAQSLARDSAEELVLTSASTRAIVLGKTLYIFATWLLLLVVLFALAISYVVGARAPLFLIAIVLAGLPLLFVTFLLGLTLAYALWYGIERIGLPERTQRLVTASVSVVAFVVAFAVGMLSGQVSGDLSADELPTGDPILPLGYYADLLFVGSPMAEPIGIRSVVAGIFVIVSIPLVFGVLVRLASAYWYTEPGRSTDESRRDDATGDDTSEGTSVAETATPEFEQSPSQAIGREFESADSAGTVARLLARFRMLRVTMGYVRHAVRRPDQYVYLFYYLFPVLALVVPLALESPSSLPLALGISFVLLGAWLAGSLFCLNPLGSEGAMLSQLVLAVEPARTFVHARLLAGIVVGLGLTIAGGGLVLVTGPTVPVSVIVAGAVLLTLVIVTSSAFALGIGSVLPKFDTVEVFDSVETLAPSLVAALVHGSVTILLLAGALGTAIFAAAPDSPLSPLQRVGVALLFVGVCLLLADGSRRYAIARLRDYGAPAVRPDRLFAVYAAIGITFFGFVLGQAVALSAVLLVGVDAPVELMLPALFVVEYAGFALAAFGFLYVTHRGIAYLDIHRPTLRELAIVAGGVFLSLVIWAAGMVFITGLGLPAADHALFDAEEGDPRLLLALVPLLLLVNGPVEELLFRNIIQKYLGESFSTAVAVGLASLIFALVHVPAYLTAGFGPLFVTLTLLFAISCFWGALYAYTESLFVVGAVHGLYNAFLVTGAYLTMVM